MLEKNNIHKYRYTTFSSFKIKSVKSCIKMQNTCAQTSLEKEELKRRRKNRDRSIENEAKCYTTFFASIFKVLLHFYLLAEIISTTVKDSPLFHSTPPRSASIPFTAHPRFSLFSSSCFFLEPYPHLPLHTAEPFGRYAAPSLQILYHFYEA